MSVHLARRDWGVEVRPRPVDAGIAYRVQSQVAGAWADFGAWVKGPNEVEQVRVSLVGSGWRILKGLGRGVWTVAAEW